MLKKHLALLLFLCVTCALHAANYLTFTAEVDSSSFGIHSEWWNNPDVQYSLDDGQTWTKLTNDTLIPLPNKKKALLKGYNPQGISRDFDEVTRFVMTGRIAASGSVMSLIDGNDKNLTITGGRCFYRLFENCTSLTQAPQLPALILGKECYKEMFSGCANLKQAPKLPATTLHTSCYEKMFSGCTNLTQASELPATQLAYNCYAGMFEDCTSLTQAPELPATQLAYNCYAGMFSGCTSLTKAPELPAKTLATDCYNLMFAWCSNLTKAPVLPATTLAKGCYDGMFNECKSLTQAPELPAKQLADGCYTAMFKGCECLTQAPELPAKQLAIFCYAGMFFECTSLTQAPELPAKQLANGCYLGLFWKCTSLTHAPELPATQLANSCYVNMFWECTSLTKAPKLPATQLSEECYAGMFSRCESLKKAPELPATRLKDGCYKGMFKECIRLTQAPELPATTLPDQCYYNMFEDCIRLPNAPYPSDTCIASPANNELYGEKKMKNGPMDTIDVLRVNQDTTHVKFNTNSIVHKYSFGRRFNRINDSKLEIKTLDRQKRFFNCEGCTIARYSVDQKEGIAYLTSIDIVSDSKDDEAHLRTTTQDGELVSDITLNLSPSMTIHLSINDSLIKIDSIGPLPEIKGNDKLKLVAIADDGRKLKILKSSWWDDDRMEGTLNDVCTDDQIVNKTFMCLQKKRWKKTWVSIWVMSQESKKIWRPCLRFFWSPKE